MIRKIQVVALLPIAALLFTGACGSTELPETEVLPTATAVPPTATAEPMKDSKILFIGDSYTDGMDDFMTGLTASSDPPLIIEADQVTFGNTSLWGHWVGPKAVPTIQKGDWTVVVLQDDLEYYDYDEERFYEYHRYFYEEIEKIGAETVLYLTWKSEGTDPMNVEKMDNAYANISAELGVKVAPVGPAWRRAMAERPDLDLYDDDRSHHNVAGFYLATAVLYATIFDTSPEGLPFMPTDLVDKDSRYFEQLKMSEEDIAFLQGIAWQTVLDYQNK